MAIQAQAVSSKRIYKQTTLNGCIYRYTDVHVTVIEDVLMHVRGRGATWEESESRRVAMT